MTDLVVKVAIGLGGFLCAVVLIGGFIAFFPEKVEKIMGWVVSGIAYVFKRIDKRAVALRVQGEVNGLRASMLRDAPDNIIEKKLKIEWTDAEGAQAAIQGGDVIVFMQDSKRHGENVANAVMAYLPKALVPRARRYVEPDTMRAVDLTVAKVLLAHEEASEGALDVFYERHFDPARVGSETLKAKIMEVDNIDLQGWLSRILLSEYRRLGDRLHPGEPTEECLAEAEAFEEWLASLAARPAGVLGSLAFPGKYLRVAIVFVALKDVLAEKGIEPYRKRAKRLIYKDRFDSVYLLARDPNISAVDALIESLESDALIESHVRHEFRLRRDYAERTNVQRERAICACLRRRQNAPVPDAPDEITEDSVEVPDETYAVPSEASDVPSSATSASSE